MSLRRGGAMQTLGVARPPCDPAARRTRQGLRVCLDRDRDIAGSQTKTANENGESEIGRLSKLAVQDQRAAGAIQHDGKNPALLELTKTEESEFHKQRDSPQKISQTQNGTALENDPAPFALGKKKDRAAREEFGAAIGAD